MLRSVRVLVLFVALLLVAAMTSKGEVLGDDPNAADTIYVDSVLSTSATRGFVPIYFFNDEDLGGIEMTLTYDSPEVSVDSFSFVEGRLEAFTLRGANQFTWNSVTVYCFPLADGLIPTGSGLLGKLHFSYVPGIEAQVVKIDTISVVLGDRGFSTVFSSASAVPFKPVFVSGYLDIQPGSCCLGDRGNIDNSPDDAVDISDLLYLVEFMFNSGPAPVCLEEANVDGSTGKDLDISDLLYLVEYMFNQGPPPATCP